jgi:hypothetical protein
MGALWYLYKFDTGKSGAFKDKLADLQRAYGTLRKSFPSGAWPDKTKEKPDDTRKYMQTFRDAGTFWRRAFVTSRGYIGIGPATMSRKDKMVLIKG